MKRKWDDDTGERDKSDTAGCELDDGTTTGSTGTSTASFCNRVCVVDACLCFRDLLSGSASSWSFFSSFSTDAVAAVASC